MVLLYTTLSQKENLYTQEGDDNLSTEAQKKANRDYRNRHKPIQKTIQYKSDKKEGLRLEAYLANTGQNANAYIKALIKSDLDAKGVPYPDASDGDESEE